MTSIRLPISQINLHRSKDAAAILAKRMASGHTWISMIQEPWTVRGIVRGVGPGCRVIASSDERPRACIALKGVSGVPLLAFCYRDLAAVACEVNTDRGRHTIVLASGYFPHEDSEVPPLGVQRLIEYCRTKKMPLILGCDANAHNSVWGSTDNNARGEDLLTYLTSSELDIANVGSEPTFKNVKRGEVLDLTLVSLSIRHLIHGWRVSDEPSLSDHATIEFGLRCWEDNEPREVHIPRSTDWAGYLRSLEQGLGNFPMNMRSAAEVDGATDLLTAIIIKSYHENSKVKPAAGKSKVPWWNTKLAKLKKRVSRAYQKAKTSTGERRELLFGEWRSIRNDYRMAVRTTREASWKSYCGKIEAGREAARLGRILASNPGAWIGAINLRWDIHNR